MVKKSQRRKKSHLMIGEMMTTTEMMTMIGMMTMSMKMIEMNKQIIRETTMKTTKSLV
ncbi:hypothetical protein J5751_04520 [bacterium]|nr:hypothetical protein [bacterium]